jgi:NDP-sugar pyrophosphorylase family protein
MTYAPAEYLNLDHTDHRSLFEKVSHVWEALPLIASYLQFRLHPAIHGKQIGRPFISNAVYIGHGTTIEQGAMIKGPAWIGDRCQIRAGCYIRENVIVGHDAVLGNSCEFKNCIVFDGAQVPHFNYVGDSILGHQAHLGAGVILSNVRLDHGEVVVRGPDSSVRSGLKKFGAIIGDRAEIGCHAVLNPGSLIGREAAVYPGVHWSGVLPARTVAKLRQQLETVPRR